MTRTEPHPHQRTPEECAADAARARLNQAKAAAHEAYVAANRAVHLLDETVDEALIAFAHASREGAWVFYTALVAETEWR